MTDSLEELYRTGTSQLHQGKIAAAIETLVRAYEIDLDHFDVSLNLAGAYILASEFGKAIPILERLVDSGRGNEAVWTNLGAAYLGNPILARNRERRKALEAFKYALEINPKAPNVAYNIGLIYRDEKEYELAAQWFSEALRTNPNDRDAERVLERIRSLMSATDTKIAKDSDEGSEFVE